MSNRLIRAHADFRTEFESEVRSRAGEARRLTADLYEVSCDTSELPYIWAKDEWPSYHKISFGSISEARNLL
ncbi:MAG: hypothetical protein RBT63_09425 [Bdellovibrionales bacterium]|nr:hypothetical protein [Bdellovibrionales bacterium]